MGLRLKVAAVLTTCTVLTAACGSSSKKSTGATATTTGGTTGGTTAGSAAATSFPPIPPGPIKFGISTPLTGAQAAFGQTTAESFNNVTLKAFNQLHPDGIDGHPVQYSVLDDASDVTKAVNVANQFVAEKLAGVITVSYNPAAYVQQLAVLNKGKIPVIANLEDPQFTDTKAWPYAFGVNVSQQEEGVAAAQYIGRKGYTRIATITDGIPSAVGQLNLILASMKTDAPNAQVVKAVTVAPGATDDSTAVAQLKGSNPDLLINLLSYGYAPLWQAIQTAGWSPNIMSTAGAWYDGFTGMGPLANKAVSFYNACADSASQTWPPDVAGLMTGYNKGTAGLSINYLTYVISDSIPLELFKYAIEKYHSLDPNAIKQALEGVNQQFFGAQFTITPTQHFGLTGQYGAAVCNMGPPYAGGDGKVPVKSS
jgi:ABC-type branched-subunit amino acid transport system substrate-binding protein